MSTVVFRSEMSYSEKFRQYLLTYHSDRDLERALKVGKKALASKTLETVEDGADLLCQLSHIESITTMDARNIQKMKDLFEILIRSGTSHQINVRSERFLHSFGGVTPLIQSISCDAWTVFQLLMANNLLLDYHFPKVLISIIGLYAFF